MDLNAVCERGGALLDQGHPAQALLVFEQALELARDQRQLGSIGWIAAHTGFAHLDLDQPASAVHYLTQAVLYGMLGNPFVHLKRGIALYETGDTTEAKNELFKAAVIDGSAVFSGEDPKYWAFAVQGMRLPAGCADWKQWQGCEPGSEMHRGICDPAQYRVFAPALH